MAFRNVMPLNSLYLASTETTAWTFINPLFSLSDDHLFAWQSRYLLTGLSLMLTDLPFLHFRPGEEPKPLRRSSRLSATVLLLAGSLIFFLP